MPRVALANADLAPPIGCFRRDVIGTGWNYWDHFDEGVGRREGLGELRNGMRRADLYGASNIVITG